MLTTFGDRNTFALEFAFRCDPDRGRGATKEESLSWGQFALWVQGNNLCQFIHNSDRSDAVHWYLLPLIEWFANNWGPLLYEEAPPIPTEKGLSARSIFFEYGKLRFGFMSENEESLWYDWGQRHSLRACAFGGIFPDVYLRGAGDKVEISWGNAIHPGCPDDLFFTAPIATAFASREVVRKVLYSFLTAASTDLLLKASDSDRFRSLQKIISEIPDNKESHISWMVPAIREGHLRFTDLVERVKDVIPSRDFDDRIPAAILMFGSCSPTILQDDIDIILENISKGNESSELTNFVFSTPFSSSERPYESGYTFAQNFIDLYPIEGDFVDIEAILAHFSINIVTAEFYDRTMRGLALAGEGLLPTIFVNTAHPNNATDQGRRYSLSHEFCHLLHDRQYGQEVGVVSGPWAPQRVEQRANAFAAMLLMPVSMIEKMIARYGNVDFGAVQDMSRTLRVSKAALIEHLHNIGAITMLQRNDMREQNAREESEKILIEPPA